MRSTLPLYALLLSTACATTPPPPPQPSPSPTPPELAVIPSATNAYPLTRRMDLVEPQFGVSVADPYRWLENDVRNDPEVRSWVTAQNAVTDTFLKTLPLRDRFKASATNPT